MACSAERETRCLSSEPKMLTATSDLYWYKLSKNKLSFQYRNWLICISVSVQWFDRHFRASSSALDEIPLESQQVPRACETAAQTKATIAPQVPIKIDLHQRRVSAGGNPLAFVAPPSDLPLWNDLALDFLGFLWTTEFRKWFTVNHKKILNVYELPGIRTMFGWFPPDQNSCRDFRLL